MTERKIKESFQWMAPEFKAKKMPKLVGKVCIVCGSGFIVPYKIGFYHQKTCSLKCRIQNNRRSVNKSTRRRRRYKLITPLGCPVCHDIFYDARGLGCHIARSHPEQPHHCYECGIKLTELNWHKNGAAKKNLCKSCHNTSSRQYYIANPQKRRQYFAKSHSKISNQIFAFLGNKCNRCGYMDKRAFQIDHVNDNGQEDKKRFGSFSLSYRKHVLRQLRKGSKDYQLLCANCNQIKQYEKKEKN